MPGGDSQIMQKRLTETPCGGERPYSPWAFAQIEAAWAEEGGGSSAVQAHGGECVSVCEGRPDFPLLSW